MTYREHRTDPARRAAAGHVTGEGRPAAVAAAEVDALLHQVIDPEVGVNIVDLGLVYRVLVDGPVVRVEMTLTTPGCPLAGYMDDAVHRVLTALPGVEDTRVDIVWDPPWSPAMMTDTAKRQLGWSR